MGARHRRRIGRSFAVASKEVTVAGFERFLASHPDVRKTFSGQNSRYNKNPDGPVVYVTWFEAMQFCRWLSEQEKVPKDQMCYPPVHEIRERLASKQPLKLPADYLCRTGYRLPTEAEWEYACRAGTTTSRFYGTADELLGKYAWYGQDTKTPPLSVGRLMPNGFGLFDVYGNALEWCADRYTAYPSSPEVIEDREDSTGPTAADRRVVRGGAWTLPASICRSGFRLTGFSPAGSYPIVGFRIARTIR
jgi:formylglycine-generating enzyme required for sulfatase activity